MASNIQKTIEIIFAGTDKASNVVQSLSGNIDSFAMSVGSITSPVADFGNFLLKMETGLIAVGAAFGAFSFGKAKEMESALADLSKVMGDNESITEELKTKVSGLSDIYGTSSIAIVNSLAGLKQSGYDTAGSFEVLETSLKLARASELDTEAATRLLKQSMIGYNLAAEDSINLGNLWNQTSNVANTTVGELAQGFSIVSRQAHDAGFAMNETSAALTPIIGVFGSGAEAGTAFSMALTRLLNPTKEGEAAIRALTGATGPLNKEFASGKDLFEAVALGLQKVDDQTGAVYTAQIVGAEQAKRIKVAFDDYGATLGKIGPMSEMHISLQKEVDVQNATTQASVDRLTASFENLLIKMGTGFQPGAKGVIDGLTEIERAFGDVIDAGSFDPLFEAVNTQFGKIEELFKTIAKNLPEAFKDVNFDDLIASFEGLAEQVQLAFQDLFGDVDLTTPEGLAEVIQKIVDGVTGLTNVVAGMVEGWRPFLSVLGEAIDKFLSSDDAAQKLVGNIIGFAQGIDKLVNNLGVITGALDLMGKAMAVIAGTQVVALIGGFGTLGAAALALAGPLGIGALIGGLTYLAGSAIGDAITNLFGLRTEIEKVPELTELKLELDTGDVLDVLTGIITDVEGNVVSVPVEFETDEEKAERVAQEAAAKMKEALEDGTSDMVINYMSDPSLKNLEAALEDAGVLIKEKLDGVDADVKIGLDVEDANTELLTWTSEDGTEHSIRVPVELDEDSLKKTKEDVDEKIPSEKELKLKSELDIAEAKSAADIFKSKAEMVQSSVEWTAKLNIAEAQAEAEKMTALSNTISTGIESTGDTIQSLTGSMSDATSQLDKWKIEDQINEERKLREKEYELQKMLTEAQVEYTLAKAEALQRDSGLIQIDGSGLAPHLEAFMFEILSAIQVKANAEGAEFLVGL